MFFFDILFFKINNILDFLYFHRIIERSNITHYVNFRAAFDFFLTLDGNMYRSERND